MIIPLGNVKPRIDYVSRIGGAPLTRQATAQEAALAMNFRIVQTWRDGDTLRLTVNHGGDPAACARWVGERLGVEVVLA